MEFMDRFFTDEANRATPTTRWRFYSGSNKIKSAKYGLSNRDIVHSAVVMNISF